MIKLKVPQGYRTALSVYDTQRAIEFIKDTFPRHLGCALNLKRVSAPLFVGAETGLNDNLNGVERPVSFDVPAAGGAELQVVHSLAKWKRLALKDTVRRIVAAICNTNEELTWAFPSLHTRLCREVTFVTSQQLEDEYPDLTPSQRELEYVRRYQTIFVMQIGKTLRSGKKHDGRAPDYDDWELNGDIIFYNSELDCAFEVSSMGIRVDAAALDRQLTAAGCNDRRSLPFHQMLLSGHLPQTIGGGIGQSRLCMLLMGCAHIGEVQSGVWDEATREKCQQAGIFLL